MLLNIIHPYTYKLKDNDLHLGAIPEFTVRDMGVAAVVNAALEKKARVLLHKYHNGSEFHAALEQGALNADPLYNILSDPAIITVVTTPFGLPRPDTRPESIAEEIWARAEQIYTPESELKGYFQQVNQIIFIGGILERCVTNIACQAHQNYLKQEQEMFYIPELCVSLDQELLERTTIPEFAKRKIKPLTIEQFRRSL